MPPIAGALPGTRQQRPSRRAVLAGAASTLAAGLLAGCGASTRAAPAAVVRRRGGVLRVGLTGGSASDTLDPHQGLTYLDTARAQALYEPLVQLDAGARIEYVLATEMTPRDPLATQWVIRLRPGVTFHDGQPLTATDVIYTMRRIITHNYSAINVLGPVDPAGIRALDKQTVLVPMTRPYATLPEQLAGILTAQIVPDGFNPATGKPNGTGPFAYHSFTAGQRSTFTRNQHYWRPGLPWAGSLQILDFPDTVSLADALRTGVVDAVGTLDGPQFTSLATSPQIKTVASKAGTIVPFTMRTDLAPFDDVRVRQALRLAASRPQLIDSALDGYGTPASDVFSPWDAEFDDALRREQDIPLAKHLLKQAGREDLHVELVTSPIATGAVAMATVLAEQAAAAGISIRLRQVDPGTFFGAQYLQWPFAQDFYSYSPYLVQATLSMLPTSPWNETHEDSPAYVRLYQEANATLNTSTRKEIAYRMQEADFTRGGYIIPAFVDTLDAYSARVTGYRESRVGQPVNDLNFAALALT
ncbi:MAG TPA: ABC transporter substrate-binding protein [Streptosporangiaceae bacterium]